MKKIFLIATIIGLLSQSLLADILTVSNNPKVPAQYSNINEAIGIANVGDTIHVQPSGISYGSVDITKSIVLIGGGFFNEQEFFLGLESRVNQITISQEADQTVIADFLILSAVIIKSEDHQETHDDITLLHNSIGRIDFSIDNDETSFTSTNISIRNNIITNINFINWNTVQTQAKINFENNIIGFIQNAGGDNILIKNNLFNPHFGGPNIALSELNDCTISSNIFLGYGQRKIGTDNTFGCVYDGNLSFLTDDEFSSPDENNNVFTDGSNFTLSSPSDLLFSENVEFFVLSQIMGIDFTLVEGSTAIGNGSDGTDMGILGGSYPFHHTARFSYPNIQSIEINNPVLGQDSKLRFTIKANYPDGN